MKHTPPQKFHRPPSTQLIVNADDLGRTTGINDGVELAFRNGIVSSASLVANSPAFEHACRVIERNSALGVGIHLALNEYPPLTDSGFLRDLGRRKMPAAFARVAFASPARIRLIEEEFRRQIEKVLAAGITLSHMDGHNHSHVHPRLVQVLIRLAEEYSIRWIRLPSEALSHRGTVKRTVQKTLLAGACGFGAFFLKDKVRWPRKFHGFSEGGNITHSRLRNILKRVVPGVNELMCHVGTENDDPPFRIGYHWLDELQAITAFSKRQLREEFGIHVISYREATAQLEEGELMEGRPETEYVVMR